MQNPREDCDSTGQDWYVSSSYPVNLKGKDVPDWFLDSALPALRIDELQELVLRGFQSY